MPRASNPEVQIIPAPGWHAGFSHGGDRVEAIPLAAFAVEVMREPGKDGEDAISYVVRPLLAWQDEACADACTNFVCALAPGEGEVELREEIARRRKPLGADAMSARPGRPATGARRQIIFRVAPEEVERIRALAEGTTYPVAAVLRERVLTVAREVDRLDRLPPLDDAGRTERMGIVLSVGEVEAVRQAGRRLVERGLLPAPPGRRGPQADHPLGAIVRALALGERRQRAARHPTPNSTR